MEPYEYSKLPTTTSIRLLEIFDTSEDGTIRCSLTVVDLEDKPTFDALSYTWGDPRSGALPSYRFENGGVVTEHGRLDDGHYDAKKSWPVKCDGRELRVTENLRDALWRLNRPMSVNKADAEHGKTILHHFAEIGDAERIDMLLSKGANVSARDKYGETPLHYAAENGHLEVVILLTTAGSDTTARNNSDRTPLGCATMQGHKECQDYLESIQDGGDSNDKHIFSSVATNHPVKRIWVDALCINQSDIAERNQQVSIMSRIYLSAQLVFLWLGKEDRYTDQAIYALETLASKPAAIFEQHKLIPYRERHSDFYEQLDIAYIDQDSWKALADLFRRQYFRRTWIIQELALANHILIHCGDKEILWADLCKVATMLARIQRQMAFPLSFDQTHQPSSANIPVVEAEVNLTILLDIRLRYRHKHEPVSLPWLLGKTQSLYQASDARDKIYALFGIASGEPSVPMADYSVPVEFVYQRFVHFTIERHKDLRILVDVQDGTLRHIRTLPSWCPDFSAWSGVASIQPSLEGQWFCAAGLASARLQQVNYHTLQTPPYVGTLELPALCIDYVEELGEKYQTTKDYDPRMIQMLSQLDTTYHYGQARGEVLMRTLIADQLHGKVLQNLSEVELAKLKKDFQAWFSHRLYLQTLRDNLPLNEEHLTELDELAATDESNSLPTAEYVRNWAEGMDKQLPPMGPSLAMPAIPGRQRRFEVHVDYLYAVRHVHVGRRLFRTRKKYLGLGFPSMEVGDSVWLMIGSQYPFILRKQPSGGYRVVGHAYVHGIMYGEALDRDDVKGLRWDNITLE